MTPVEQLAQLVKGTRDPVVLYRNESRFKGRAHAYGKFIHAAGDTVAEVIGILHAKYLGIKAERG